MNHNKKTVVQCNCQDCFYWQDYQCTKAYIEIQYGNCTYYNNFIRFKKEKKQNEKQ